MRQCEIGDGEDETELRYIRVLGTGDTDRELGMAAKAWDGG